MANIENINRLIELLKADDGSHFKMAMFVQHLEDEGRSTPQKYVECGTACCLAGWANTLSLADHGLDFKKLKGDAFIAGLVDSERAQIWLGLSDQMAETLFDAGVGFLIEGEFDDLPPEVRRNAGIRVLEILRDEDRLDWREAINFCQLAA